MTESRRPHAASLQRTCSGVLPAEPNGANFMKLLAEGVGFEPTDACTSAVFKTAAIDHSATLPSSAFRTSASDRSATHPSSDIEVSASRHAAAPPVKAP